MIRTSAIRSNRATQHIQIKAHSLIQNTIFLICETHKNICRKLDLTGLKVEKLEMKLNNAKLVTQNDGNQVSHSARSSLF